MSVFGVASLLIALAPLLIAIALCVHVVRTNQPLYWIFLILFVPVLGSVPETSPLEVSDRPAGRPVAE